MFTQQFEQISFPLTPFAPYPAATDRAAWKSLPEDLKGKLIAGGERYLDYEYPVIRATDYMDFCRTGNRDRYQAKQFDRRIALNHLVLAECVEQEGRFLDDIINGIFAICEETGWQLPAHNSYIRDTPQLPLPDPTRPVIDLFSAETGAVLAVVCYLLKEELEAISPAILQTIRQALEEKILIPYLGEHFWWMGDGKSHLNNWTSWCTQNVLLVAGFCPSEKVDMKQVYAKACQSLDYFLEEYGEDGCCDEGAQYFRHAGLTLFNAVEVLNALTDNAFASVYKETKIRNMAAYIQNVHVHDQYYANFADCSPVAGRCGAREYLFAKRTEQPELMAFAVRDFLRSEDPLMDEEHNLFYHLETVFTWQEMMDFPLPASDSYRDLYFPSAGLFLARDSRLFLAVKAGDNDDSHNHNDTGSFTVYKDGKPLFIDVGVETYTRKTFSANRYEIWTMQSRFHNLPTFGDDSGVTAGDDIPLSAGGVIQKAGPEYRAVHVETSFSDTQCRISMDIAPAYGDSGIRSYRREAVLYKGQTGGEEADGRIVVSDLYDGDVSPAVLSLMTYEKPVSQALPNGGFCLKIGDVGECQIAGASQVEIETIPIQDPRLQGAWKHEIYRSLVRLSGAEIRLEIR